MSANSAPTRCAKERNNYRGKLGEENSGSRLRHRSTRARVHNCTEVFSPDYIVGGICNAIAIAVGSWIGEGAAERGPPCIEIVMVDVAIGIVVALEQLVGRDAIDIAGDKVGNVKISFRVLAERDRPLR